MTETQFINKEISVWGFDYIESLLEEGYEPKLTVSGWTWVNVGDSMVNLVAMPTFTIESLALAA